MVEGFDSRFHGRRHREADRRDAAALDLPDVFTSDLDLPLGGALLIRAVAAHDRGNRTVIVTLTTRGRGASRAADPAAREAVRRSAPAP